MENLHFYSEDDLVARIRNEDQPVAFLIGSPLSLDAKGGVPGVKEMIDIIRAHFNAAPPDDLARFEAAVSKESPEVPYQRAMAWLQGNVSQSFVNDVVKTAVLRSRLAGPERFSNDGEPKDWHIPVGTRQLAELCCSHPERFPGPILTTNFDPLVSLAFRESKGSARLRVIHSDGSINQDVENAGEWSVVHLHGYWRGGDTLHTPTQLTLPRPKLKTSLQALLRRRTLVVVAYGGWDDAFMRALEEVCEDDSVSVNVLWCFHETDDLEIQAKYAKMLGRTAPAILRARLTAYKGIDCHTVFERIRTGLPASGGSLSGGVSPIVGWELIGPDHLARQPAIAKEELIKYFDGAVPTWQHAIAPGIPERREVAVSLERLREAPEKGRSSIHLIRGAGGEGKTTVLLQVVARLAREDKWRVLWKKTPNEVLPPEHVLNLDRRHHWLLVADEADNQVEALSRAAQRLSETSQSHVHFFVAARDADWRAAKGDDVPWGDWLLDRASVGKAILLQGLFEDDAKAIVTAWGKCGADALGELKREDIYFRPRKLLQAVRDASEREDETPDSGSFFGGLLAVRVGDKGLRAHVRAFLKRLQSIPIMGTDFTLFDALLYVAATHSVGIRGVPDSVLADLLGVPRTWVYSRVVRPLGAEAAAVHNAGRVQTRHSKVAAAIVLEAESSFHIDMAEVWRALVSQTAATSAELRVGEVYGPILHSGPTLAKQLPPGISPQRKGEIALAAASAAVAARPNRLSCIVDLGNTHRLLDQPEQGARVFETYLAKAEGFVDYNEIIRGYYNEWAVCEGYRHNNPARFHTQAWLAGIAISDELAPVGITNDNIVRATAGLAYCFRTLAKKARDVNSNGTLAAAFIGRRALPDKSTLARFEMAERAETEHGSVPPKSMAEALSWLGQAVSLAGGQTDRTPLRALAESTELSFETLRSKLASSAASPGASR